MPWPDFLAVVPLHPGTPTLNSNHNIAARLDLAQALKTFSETITAALALEDVAQWDGRTI
jgi:hypothetical protein